MLFSVTEDAEYYNIESSVGSRVAQQLQKGDKVRIGINGNVQSQDLKIKKWNREARYKRSMIQIIKYFCTRPVKFIYSFILR